MGQRTAIPPDHHDGASSPGVVPSPSSSVRRTGFQYATGDRPLEGFTIKFGIDHGGFGEVYYAVSDGGKEVALKLLRRNLDVELRGVSQCLNLKHPHLLTIFDLRQDSRGDYWIIMEYVAGESLEDCLAASPAGLPVDEIGGWFQGIASGLAYLHGRGLVHRDLKPSNVFREEGIVKIGDYSLCKFISSTRRSGQTESVGTVHYMAPEIANGRYGKEVDIYAAGVILYEMLTGRVPFEGESVGEILMKHMVAQPDLTPVHPAFRPIVARALEKDPDKRYRDIREMAADVARSCRQLAAATTKAAEAVAPNQTEALTGYDSVHHGGLKELWRRLRLAWTQSNLDTPTKFLLVSLVLIFLFTTAGRWIPLLTLFVVMYGGWVLLRRILRGLGVRTCIPIAARDPADNQEKTQKLESCPEASTFRPLPNELPSAGQQGRFGKGLPQWARRPLPRAYAPLDLRTEVEDLLVSLLKAAFITIVMNLIMLLPLGFRRGEVFAPELVGWLLVVSTSTAWMVLVASFVCRATKLDPVLTRFLFMVGGLMLGAAACAVAHYLDVRLPLDPGFAQLPDYKLPSTFYDGEGRPQLAAFLAVFGSLFLVPRWWKYIQPDRPSRLSVGVTAWCGLVGWLVAVVWAFPHPWILVVACATAVTIQLSSRWNPPPSAEGSNS